MRTTGIGMSSPSGSSVHERRYTTAPSVVRPTPNSRASRASGSPFAARHLISRTRDQSSTARGFFSPMGARRRPFAYMSLMFARCEPRNRWSGLTHPGLSHEWHTLTPAGIEPYANSHETRCAFTTFRLRPMAPYPCTSRDAVHSQQSADLSTFSQKRCSNGRAAGMCPLYSKDRT